MEEGYKTVVIDRREVANGSTSDNNYNNTSIGQSAKFQLPTALHVLADYRLTKKFLVSAQADISLVKQDNELTNNVINTFTLAPRLETKWFSLYAPVEP
jgi:predicted porin